MNRKLLLKKAFAIMIAFSGGLSIQTLQAQWTNPVYTVYSGKITPGSTNEVMVFTPAARVTQTAFVNSFNSNISALGSANSPLKLLNSVTDSKLVQHNVYVQNIAGVEVENNVVKTHVKNQIITSAAIFTAIVPVSDVTPAFSATVAYTKALAFMGTGATAFTNPRLVLRAPKLLITQDDAGQYVLAYKVDVFSKTPQLRRQFVYVNAKTGTLIRKVDRGHNCGTPTVQTRYDGQRQINDNPIPPFTNQTGVDVLYNDCNGDICGGSTTDLIETISYDDVSGGYAYYGKPTGSPWPNTLNYQIAYQAHWGLAKVYDYYKCTYGRNGYDGLDAPIVGVTHWNYYNGQLNPDNAAWNGDGWILFGDGGDAYSGTQSKGAIVALDVVGHEITHGITEQTAQLVYKGESGALNEAWSDIFGTETEFYAKSATANYNIGEDVWKSGFLRSMSNPKLRNQPNTYGGTYWQATTGCIPDPLTNDNCGVHTNSGVANYWFYLLSAGGTGINDLGNAYSVNSITRAKAAAIAYNALVYYFTPNTNFAQARAFTIQAAELLYGQCSAEALEVAKAWYAVGVGSNPVNTMTGPATVCPYQTNVTYAITAHPGSTYTWSTPPLTSVVSGNGTNSLKINFNGTAPGIRTVSVSEYTSDVCVNVSKTITVLDAVANGATCDAYPKPLSPNGLSFDGTDDVAFIPAHAKMGLGLGDFTYEIIIKSNPSAPLASYGGQAESLLGNYGESQTGSAELWTNRATCSTCSDYVSFRSGNAIVGITTNLRDNKCHHIAVVKTSTDTKMYMDGVLQGIEPIWRDFGPTGNGVNPTQIGGYYDANQSPQVLNVFNGSIKELRIWKSARTQAEIQKYMNRALYGSEANLVAYYPFDETGTGEIINDRISPTATLQLNNGYRGSSPSTTANNPTAIAGTCTTVNTRLYNFDMPFEGAEVTENGIAAYPNPFTSELTFSADFTGKTYSVELINALGSVVYKDKNLVSGANYSITTELSPGYYVLKFNDGNVIKTRTVIKN